MAQKTSHTIGGFTLILNHDHRIILIEEEIIRLTPTEFQLLLCIIDGSIAQDEMLAEKVLGNQTDLTQATRYNLEKHINNIRVKIRPFLNIYRVHNYGYLINSK